MAFLVALAAAAGLTQARQTHSLPLSVSAQVSPSASVGLELVSQPVDIKSADLERGYVEFVMKSRMRMKNIRRADLRPAVAITMEQPPGDGNGNGNGHGSHSGQASTHVVETSSAGDVAEFRYRFEFSRVAQAAGGGTISVAVDL